jgi:hypothetical protein
MQQQKVKTKTMNAIGPAAGVGAIVGALVGPLEGALVGPLVGAVVGTAGGEIGGSIFSISMPSTHCAIRIAPLLPGPWTGQDVRKAKPIHLMKGERLLTKIHRVQTVRTDNGTTDDRSQTAHLRQRIIETAHQRLVCVDYQDKAITDLPNLLELGREAGATVAA